MRKTKKLLAVLTVAAMVLCPLTAFAAPSYETDPDAATNSGSAATGDSFLEGVTPDDVFTVVLPTVTANTYDFVLDPDQLLSQADADKTKYTAGDNVYFHNTANSTDKYTDLSDGAVAVNAGMTDVILTVDVEVTNTSECAVEFSDTDVMTGDSLGLYMAVIPADKGTVTDTNLTAGTVAVGNASGSAVVVDKDGTASVSFLLEGQADNYELTQGSPDTVGHKYNYTKKASPAKDWNTAGFYLTATCNDEADWSEFNKKSHAASNAENLSVSVVWTMTNLTDEQAAQIEDGTVTPDATSGVVEFETAPVVPADVAPTAVVSSGDYSKSAPSNVVISYNLGSGAPAIPEDATITVTHGNEKITILAEKLTIDTSAKTITVDGTAAFLVNKTVAGSTYPINVTFTKDELVKTFTVDVSIVQ